MHPDNLVRTPGECCELGYRNRRSIGGNNYFGTADFVQIAENTGLYFQFLGRGFYCRIASCELGSLEYGLDALQGHGSVLGGNFLFSQFTDQIFADGLDAAIEKAWIYVAHQNLICAMFEHSRTPVA